MLLMERADRVPYPWGARLTELEVKTTPLPADVFVPWPLLGLALSQSMQILKYWQMKTHWWHPRRPHSSHLAHGTWGHP